MLGPARFRVGGLEVQPFAIAPWSDDTGARHQELPKILQRLRGEWPCVPYGIERSDMASLPPDWRTREAPVAPAASHPHGWSSNAEWQPGEISDSRIELLLEYPALH